MFDPLLSAEQREIRETVRDFVQRELKPHALNPDYLQAAEPALPASLYVQASQMGLRTLSLSEALGGAGANTLTACLVAEELAAGEVGYAATFARTSHLGHRLFDVAMSAAQRERYLPDFLNDPDFHLAYAGCERDPDDGGWNYHRPQRGEIEVPVTAVRAADGDWLLTGVHRHVANAACARVIAVQARTVPGSKGLAGVSVFLVPRAAAGLDVRPIERFGADEDGEPVYRWVHGPSGTVTLKDCRIPAADLLGPDESGGILGAAAAAGRGSPIEQALNLGIGRAALEAATEYAGLRVQGGRRIIEHQAIGTMLAEIAIRLETARGLVWRAAWAADHPEAAAEVSGLPLQTVARVHTSQAMYEAALLAAECFGAMGVMKDMPMQKYVHDALVFVHADSGNGTATLQIAEELAGYRRA